MYGLMERLSKGGSERRQFRERRATRRLPVELEVEERLGKTRYVRITHDLSTFGMSTRQGHTPVVGARLTLRLSLPGEAGKVLKIEAEVLGPYDKKGGMRLKFRHPSLAAMKRIHRFLEGQP